MNGCKWTWLEYFLAIKGLKYWHLLKHGRNQDAFKRWRSSLLFLICWVFLSWKDTGFCQMLFLYFEVIIHFSALLLIRYITLIDFSDVKPTLKTWNKFDLHVVYRLYFFLFFYFFCCKMDYLLVNKLCQEKQYRKNLVHHVWIAQVKNSDHKCWQGCWNS